MKLNQSGLLHWIVVLTGLRRELPGQPLSETWHDRKERDRVTVWGWESPSYPSPFGGSVPGSWVRPSQQVCTGAVTAVQCLGGNSRTGLYYFSHLLCHELGCLFLWSKGETVTGMSNYPTSLPSESYSNLHGLPPNALLAHVIGWKVAWCECVISLLISLTPV